MQDFPLGAEGAGVVVAVGPGGAGSLTVGQAVAFNGASAFSEFVTLTRGSVVTPIPPGLGGAEAVALILSGVTACAALEVTAAIQPGEAVAVTAAAGGTGHLATQIAALQGCTVVALVGGPRKADAAEALGAQHVIDYSRQDVQSSLRRLFPGGLDVVYEGVGGHLREALLDCLGPMGRLLQGVEGVADAVDYMLRGQHVGKVVIEL
ncbi:hypothetical protein GPECTOR_16g638 [Gonium pectorale]|uniref:Enoyl reductase (ER) domain-containing protein n=1 Tax=Gonium pectorale TaxID=33097 RepID=A0A150GKZ6_GONPE|nr:hypothetical protein GPECTOR_16g638 [Gonium pectorale]|eukprot:KXZ50464.1 hypothetical protein GPECTOR_16g638 [Gonium pectorale]